IPAIGQLASIHFYRKEKAEGKAMMKRYFATGPDTAQKRVQAGDIYLEHGFQKEAQAEFKKAIEIEPSAECYFHIGECYWENEQDKNAIKYFNLAAEKADVDLLLTMAVTCAQGGETKHFNRYIEKALLLDPTHPLPYAVRGMTKLMTDPISLLLNPNLLQGTI